MKRVRLKLTKDLSDRVACCACARVQFSQNVFLQSLQKLVTAVWTWLSQRSISGFVTLLTRIWVCDWSSLLRPCVFRKHFSQQKPSQVRHFRLVWSLHSTHISSTESPEKLLEQSDGSL